MARKMIERRVDKYGELRLMGEAEGYCMVRRRGASPTVLSRKEWDALAEPPAT